MEKIVVEGQRKAKKGQSPLKGYGRWRRSRAARGLRVDNASSTDTRCERGLDASDGEVSARSATMLIGRGDDLATVWIRKERQRGESNGEVKRSGWHGGRLMGAVGSRFGAIHVRQATALGPGSGFAHLEPGSEAGKANTKARPGPAQAFTAWLPGLDGFGPGLAHH
ncbi:hypothetical protein BC826DRAFT_975475 [Russula brevipes]|nr:hypothetical protein BC826DRAFT_975475 [Russula brevipes]